MKSELIFPLIGVICNRCDEYELNFLYTPEELKERDKELATQCMNLKRAKSTLSSSHVTVIGIRLDNRKALYDFLKGCYNNTKNDIASWYFENSKFDLYNSKSNLHTMEKALEEYNTRIEIAKMLTISITHITKRTAELLENSEWCRRHCLMVCKKQEFGWFVYVPDYINYLCDIPDDLKNCIKFAADNQAQWLCLDSDGPVMEDDGLDVYEW